MGQRPGTYMPVMNALVMNGNVLQCSRMTHAQRHASLHHLSFSTIVFTSLITKHTTLSAV